MDYTKFKSFLVEVTNGIATVTMNKPEAMNGVGGNGINHREAEDIWQVLAVDPEVKVIVLTGAGKAFSAGGDINTLIDVHGSEEGWKNCTDITRDAKRLVGNILDVPQPIIAAVNGHAMGIGITLALLSDISVVSETAKVGDTHVRVGLVAGDGGTITWPLLLGINRAKDFLMRGLIIDGKEAERIGLVNYAVPGDQVMNRALEIAEELRDLPPLAVKWTKAMINQVLREQFVRNMDGVIAYEAMTMNSRDHLEAARSFVEKHKPVYKGE